MNLKKNKKFNIILSIFLCLIFIVFAGCSKEAKKERHWKRGEKYFLENKFKEAIIEYKNVIQIDPQNAKARYKLGLSLLSVGQFREAFAEFSKFVDIDKDFIDARIQ